MIYQISRDQTFYDLTLSNPKWKINSVNYCWNTNKAHIEVYLTEGAHWHSRTWSADASSNMTNNDCINYILSLNEFEGSEVINE